MFVEDIKFTFQYGSTLIEEKKEMPTIKAKFTFQYGSTLIKSLSFKN